ncbi:ParA family protein [Staphylococcus haemolyticus]|uniref:ParA family protein n=1 Tax=Staphylococcus haemolyticus TaxID=1283 RepID=UPI001F0AF4C2|nr:ParA family protein [Staphylococcus haemolyticus]MCH4519530.1 ParA family protein [Staphylococcus haemolyticus]
MSNKKEKQVIVTINHQKGGTGKSTLTKNITNYLAYEKGKKVLNIDGDYSGYLSIAYYDVKDPQGTIGEVFKPENVGADSEMPNVKYHKIDDNISLVAYDSILNQRTNYLLGERNNRYVLIKWFLNDPVIKEFDYIIIDTHNDFGLFTQNAIAISDIVLAPIDPSEDEQETVQTRMDYEFNKLKKELINPFTDESYVKANMYLVGNKFMHNFGEHQKFLKQLQERDDYLTYFPHKALFAKAAKQNKPFEELMKNDSGNHKRFYEQYKIAMEAIYEKLKESGEE